MHISRYVFLGALVAMQLLNQAHAAGPVVNLIRPTNGASYAVGTPILVRATATASNATLASLDFLAGTNFLRRFSGTLTNGIYSFMWSNAPAGTHQLHAEAEDNAGDRGVSASAQIVVTNTPPSNNVPVVSLIQPANASVFPVGTPILLRANASDSDGTLTNIDFFASATLLGSISGTLTNGVYSLMWSNPQPGMYSVRAEAVDNAGGRGVSAPVQVSVTGVTNTNTCQISISSTGRVHGAGSETAVIGVSMSAGCSWSFANTNSWISALPMVGGTNGGALQYTVAANPSAFSRTGVITFSGVPEGISSPGPGVPYVVTQSGTGTNVPPDCSVVLSPPGRSHASGVSTGMVTVTTGSNCVWLANSSNSWLTVLSPATNLGSGTVTYRVASNTGSGRTGHIRIDGQNFTVTQAGITNGPPTNNALPVITLTRPAGGAAFALGSPILITASASVPVGTLTNIEFLANTTVLHRFPGLWTNGLFTFNWTDAPVGTHLLRAFAWDNAGALGTSAPVQITVSNTNAPPTNLVPVVNWVRPTNGASFPAGSTILLTARATDGDGMVNYVEFFATPTNQPSITVNLGRVFGAPSNSLYTLSWSNAPAGTFHLQAVAGDNVGARGYSDVVQVAVPVGPLPAIQVISVSPEVGVDLIIYGQAGRTHVVECSEDTVTWTPISSAVMSAASSMPVRDASPTTVNSRFYRVIELP